MRAFRENLVANKAECLITKAPTLAAVVRFPKRRQHEAASSMFTALIYSYREGRGGLAEGFVAAVGSIA